LCVELATDEPANRSSSRLWLSMIYRDAAKSGATDCRQQHIVTGHRDAGRDESYLRSRYDWHLIRARDARTLALLENPVLEPDGGGIVREQPCRCDVLSRRDQRRGESRQRNHSPTRRESVDNARGEEGQRRRGKRGDDSSSAPSLL